MQIEKTTARGPHKIRTGIAKIIALAILPAAMAGCQHDQPTQVAGWTLIDPAQRHPILVSRQPENLALNVGRGSQGLTPMQRARVLEFVSQSKSGDAGNSRFVISAPGGSANESAARDAADEVHQLLIDGGYSEFSIAIGAYQASGRDAPLRISYRRYVAEAPDCGQDWSQNLAANLSKYSVSQSRLRGAAEFCCDGFKSGRSARAQDDDRAQTQIAATLLSRNTERAMRSAPRPRS